MKYDSVSPIAREIEADRFVAQKLCSQRSNCLLDTYTHCINLYKSPKILH